MVKPTAPDMPHEIWARAQELISSEIKKAYGEEFEHKIGILWFVWCANGAPTLTPSEEWRALAVTNDLPETVYFEVGYSSDFEKHYVDAYTRIKSLALINRS